MLDWIEIAQGCVIGEAILLGASFIWFAIVSTIKFMRQKN